MASSDTPPSSPDAPQPDVKGAEPQVDETIAAETAQGFQGSRIDPTPLENYTLGGVVADKPTPETDEQAAQTAQVAVQGNS